MRLHIGEEAPQFSLADQNGKKHMLGEYGGKWILLYFYPKDGTPGCTTEACVIRDNFPEFENIHAIVLGISTDSVKSHKKFAEKYGLPFTLLSDEEKKAVNDYDVWHPKKFMGREYMGVLRTSFLITPKGKIAKIYEKVNPKVHAQEVLHDLKNFS